MEHKARQQRSHRHEEHPLEPGAANGERRREGYRVHMRPIPLPFEQCKTIMVRDVRSENGFCDFEAWCHAHADLRRLVGFGAFSLRRAPPKRRRARPGAHRRHLEQRKGRAQRQLTARVPPPTERMGHDKSLAIMPYRELARHPFLFFLGDGVYCPCAEELGDGVSDLTAARHADLLLVKHCPGGQKDLAVYCLHDSLPDVLEEDVHGAQRVIHGIVTGEMTKKQVLATAVVRA